ncbi:MAG: DUF3597 domain-containing protein [Thermoanaerobaculia bacterium]
MGMFQNLMNKIFHTGVAAPSQGVERAKLTPEGPKPAAAAATAAAVLTEVDVEKVLDAMAAKNPQKLDWKHSIVDLMKLVDMDSSFAARKELAADLKYTGDTNDSATMNLWLHKEVMKKLAANGGKVPAELLSH